MPGHHNSSGFGVKPRLSRRAFVSAGAASAALAGADASAVRYDRSHAYAQGGWDEEVDIVAIGSGAAGLTAALIAADLGSTVVVIEKAPSVGGTTARSNRGYWIPNNPWQRTLGLDDSPERALDYMTRVAYPELYDPEDDRLGLPESAYSLLEAFAGNAASAIEALDRLGALKSDVALDWNGQPAPDHFAELQGDHPVFGRSLVTVDANGDLANGAELVRQLRAAAESRGVEIRTGYQADRLVYNERREVIGIETRPATEPATPEAGAGVHLAIGARKAVLFASGGFTHDPELVLSFQHSPIFGGYAVPTNQGDVVRIAGAVGAKLGNMRSAFRAQVVVDQALSSRSVPNDVFAIPGDGFLIVNRRGERVVNEKSPHGVRAEAHASRDTMRGDWTNLILFLVYDQRQADTFAGIHPFPAAGSEAEYVLTGETWEDLRARIERRLAEIADRTGGFALDDAFDERLQETLQRFNRFADAGKDADFGRGDSLHDVTWATVAPPPEQLSEGEIWPATDQRNVTMRALAGTGPYHAILLGAGTLDTSGGPTINARGQIVDQDDQPIPGLYGAGNCIASPSAGADFGGGTSLGLSITFGYIAARHAHEEPPKTS